MIALLAGQASRHWQPAGRLQRNFVSNRRSHGLSKENKLGEWGYWGTMLMAGHQWCSADEETQRASASQQVMIWWDLPHSPCFCVKDKEWQQGDAGGVESQQRQAPEGEEAPGGLMAARGGQPPGRRPFPLSLPHKGCHTGSRSSTCHIPPNRGRCRGGRSQKRRLLHSLPVNSWLPSKHCRSDWQWGKDLMACNNIWKTFFF